MVWQFRDSKIYNNRLWPYWNSGLSEADWLKRSPEELYDLSVDIGERNDISTRNPEATQRLLRELEKWDKLGAPLAFGGADGPDRGTHPHPKP